MAPVLFVMAAGFALNRGRVLDAEAGNTVFRLVFYATYPALILTSLARVPLDASLALFVIAGIPASALGYTVARTVVGRRSIDERTAAVLFVGGTLVNAGFTLPIVESLYGTAGVARIALFDAAGVLFALPMAQFLSAAAGAADDAGTIRRLTVSVAKPTTAAAVCGVVVNLTAVPVPMLAWDCLHALGDGTPALIGLAIGILLASSPRIAPPMTWTLVLIRLPTGLVVFGLLAWSTRASGMDLVILGLLGVAPIGFATVMLASLDKLNVELATAALTRSIAVSVVLSGLLVGFAR